MLSRAEIRSLTPQGRTQLFDDLCALLYRTQEEAADALEVSRRTVVNWRSKHNVPLHVLYALHAMTQEEIGAQLAATVSGLGEVAAAIERTAQLLDGISRRLGSGGPG